MKLMRYLVVIFTVIMFVAGPTQARSLIKDYKTVTVQNFDQEYEEVTKVYHDIRSQTSTKLRRDFKNSKGKSTKRFSKKQYRLMRAYKTAKGRKEILDPIYNLRNDLIKLYEEQHKTSSYDKQALYKESTDLSVGLIKEIAVLKKKYKSIFIPILHNMMIDVGVRKRGACKHWAEDLLTHMRPKNRKFFDVTWGEANPQKMTEHNVAVIVARDRPFNEGMMVDPWRTSGKPFWIKLKNDKHYKWQQWADYGIF